MAKENLYTQYPNIKDFINFLIKKAQEYIVSENTLDFIEEKLIKFYDVILDPSVSDEQVTKQVSASLTAAGTGTRERYFWSSKHDRLSGYYMGRFMITPFISFKDRKKFELNLGCYITIPSGEISKEEKEIIINELLKNGYIKTTDSNRYINKNMVTHQFLLTHKIDISNNSQILTSEIVKLLKTNGFEENQDYIIKTSSTEIFIKFNSNAEHMEETSTWDSKKLLIGDSVKFKDGRTGIVEDYDDKYFYIKDSNANTVRIIKDDIVSIVSNNLNEKNLFKKYNKDGDLIGFDLNLAIENILERGNKMDFLYNIINNKLESLQKRYEQSHDEFLNHKINFVENIDMGKVKNDYEEVEKVLSQIPASIWNKEKKEGSTPYPIYTENDLEEEDPHYFNYGIRNAYEF